MRQCDVLANWRRYFSAHLRAALMVPISSTIGLQRLDGRTNRQPERLGCSYFMPSAMAHARVIRIRQAKPESPNLTPVKDRQPSEFLQGSRFQATSMRLYFHDEDCQTDRTSLRLRWFSDIVRPGLSLSWGIMSGFPAVAGQILHQGLC
jgi:hypothetical protein